MTKASRTTAQYAHDALVAKSENLMTEVVTVPADTAAYKRGVLLGKRLIGALTSAFTGTGNGALTGLVAKKLTQAGQYVLTCVTAAADGGVFSVVAPDGTRLADATVGVAYANDHLGFTINDGATDFAAGAKFTVTVAVGDGKVLKSLAAAVDGTQHPAAIAAEDTELSGADQELLVYTAGDFLASEIDFGAGHAAASVKDGLRAKGIVLH